MFTNTESIKSASLTEFILYVHLHQRKSIQSYAILHSSSNLCINQSLQKISSPACFNRQTSPVNSEDRPALWASGEQKQKRQRRRWWSQECRSSIISPPARGARQAAGASLRLPHARVMFPTPPSPELEVWRRCSRTRSGSSSAADGAVKARALQKRGSLPS